MEEDNFRQPESSSAPSNSKKKPIIFKLPPIVLVDKNKRPKSSLNTSGASSSVAESSDPPVPSKNILEAIEASKPIINFELNDIKPIKRTALDLDSRFFPTGIPPGCLMELKGESGAGKTIFITYLLARVVVSSPTKTALLIDTQHHFNNYTLINMISHFDDEIKFDGDYSMELWEIIEANPKLEFYLNRISTIKCYNAEQLLVTLGPGHDSTVENMLLTDPNLSLVIVDSVDAYSYISAFKGCTPDQYPNFVHLLRHAVTATQCPVICTTSSFLNNSITVKKRTPSGGSGSETQEQRFGPCLSSSSESNSSANASASCFDASEASKCDNNTSGETKEGEEPNWYCNVIMDDKLFTHTMELGELEGSETDEKLEFLRQTHLRSRHKPKTALFSVVNHRAKFSIFSDMLYYVDG